MVQWNSQMDCLQMEIAMELEDFNHQRFSVTYNDDCKLKDTILCCPVIWRDVM